MAEITNKEHKVTQITPENIHLFKDLDVVAWSYSPDCMATIWIIDSDGNEYYVEEDELEPDDIKNYIPSSVSEDIEYLPIGRRNELYFYPEKWESLRKTKKIFPKDSTFVERQIDVTLWKLDGKIEGHEVKSIEYNHDVDLYTISTDEGDCVYDSDMNAIIPLSRGYRRIELLNTDDAGNNLQDVHFLCEKCTSSPNEPCKYETSLIDCKQNVLFTFPFEVLHLECQEKECFLVDREGAPYVVDNRGECISGGERVHLTLENRSQYEDYFLLERVTKTWMEDWVDEDTGDVVPFDRISVVVELGRQVSTIDNSDFEYIPKTILIWKSE